MICSAIFEPLVEHPVEPWPSCLGVNIRTGLSYYWDSAFVLDIWFWQVVPVLVGETKDEHMITCGILCPSTNTSILYKSKSFLSFAFRLQKFGYTVLSVTLFGPECTLHGRLNGALRMSPTSEAHTSTLCRDAWSETCCYSAGRWICVGFLSSQYSHQGRQAKMVPTFMPELVQFPRQLEVLCDDQLIHLVAPFSWIL